jgi:steroid delta-isomerase
MIRAGSDGLIRESKAFWGRSDIGVLTASPPPGLRAEGAPVDEASGKAGALAYARLMNAGDVDGILDMFTDDVVFEDPVGTEPIRGMDELRSHIAWSISCGTYERPDRVVSSVDGRWVVVPTTVVVHHPLKITFRIIGVNERADDGRTRHARAFWGVSNTKVGDGRDRTGLEHVLTVVDALRQMRNPDRDPGGDRASPA